MKRIVAFVMIIMSCTSKGSEEKLNNEAIILHNSMIKKSGLIENRLVELKNDSTVNQDSVTHFLESLKQWKSDLVEIPGNENHEHDDHSHHDHSPVDVTTEQMLEIQKDLDIRLSNIGKRTNQLKLHDETLHQH